MTDIFMLTGGSHARSDQNRFVQFLAFFGLADAKVRRAGRHSAPQPAERSFEKADLGTELAPQAQVSLAPETEDHGGPHALVSF
jgi:hypothetical protein